MNDMKVTETSVTIPHTDVNVTENDVTNTTGDCIVLKLQDYIPWDNPDNLVSAEVEFWSDAVKSVILLPLLFLIGGPANVINMAVFWRQGLSVRINVCLFALSLADELYLIQCMIINGERFSSQFSTGERYGSSTQFLANHNLIGLFGFTCVSQVMSAIIASERCFCVVSPLRSQRVLSTRTMGVVIVGVYVVVVGLYFLVASRYHISCVRDPLTGKIFNAVTGGDFYRQNEQLINYLDYFTYGVGLPGVVMVVVITTTIITTVTLRRSAAWRARASSLTPSTTLATAAISARDVSLTKMLIATSLFFVVCVSPICLFRVSLFFLPEMNAERRQHNTFFFVLWLLEVLSYVNSSFNIVVYYTMGSRYRHTLREMLCCRRQTKRKVGAASKRTSKYSVSNRMAQSGEPSSTKSSQPSVPTVSSSVVQLPS